MHKKYLSEDPPTLADGDYMGIFFKKDDSQLSDLVLEGLSRGEDVRVSPEVCDLLPANLQEKISLCAAYTLSDLHDSIVKQKKRFRPGATGVRYLLDSKNLYENVSSEIRSYLLDEILKEMMQGEVSVGIVHFCLENLKLNELSSYPRIYINGTVITNKFFVLPNRLNSHNSELSILFEDTKLNSIEFPSAGATFPIGVPDMLESIIESMGVGVVVGDIYGNMVLYNRAVSKMVGMPSSQLPYAERIRRFGNYLPDKVTPFPFEELPLSRAVRGEDFENDCIYIKNVNKPEGAWIKSSGRGVRNSEGELIGGVLVSRDVTEEKKLQEEKDNLELNLVQNQKLESLSVLAGGIAHDFNNLLVGILGNASIILQQGGIEEILRPRLEQIQQAGFQLSDLTKQLLIYAGIHPGRVYQELDLNLIISSMLGLMEAAMSKKIELSLELERENLAFYGDEVQLRQILLNLAINAADAYGSAGGELRIRSKQSYFDVQSLKKLFFSGTAKEGFFIGFEVEDDAGGIAEELVSKVFDPFFSTKEIGRGLGLSAVLGIVKAHGGCLDLRTKVGEGTKFTLWFPAAFSVAKKKVPESTNLDKECFSGQKILLVDDEELVLEVAESILVLNGLSALKARSGLEGIKVFEENASDLCLIILDMNMPDINGDDVYREIRKINRHVPVVISSGFAKEFCTLDLSEDKNCYFLEKPYSVDKLLEIIHRVVN